MKPNRTRAFSPVTLALTGLLLNFNLPAQIGGGSIIGFITDATKAAVPGADVKATNVDSNVTSSTITSGSGYFEFPLLPAGKYIVETEKTGFRPAKSAPFTLSTGTQPRLDLTLEVAGTARSVEVTAQAPLVNAATTDLGQVVGSGKVEALPLNGRNWQQLVNLQPGASGTPANAVGSRGGMSFNGSPGYGNQLLLDGVDMSFGEVSSAPTDQAGGAGTSLIGGVSVAAISEVKVNSSSFSAEYGGATGGVVNITSKTGTNQFHGELFEFFRNDKLDATDFFTNKAGLRKPPLRWNQFGGNLGGPVMKNKLFFFFNYEAARVHNAVQLSGNTPTPLLLSQLTPALRENASGMPQNFTPTSNPLLGFSIRNSQQEDSENTTLSRADYNMGHQRLAVRFSYNWSNFLSPQFRPANVQSAPFHFYNVSAEHTDSITPTALNEFRFGFSRNNLDRKSSTLGVLPGWFQVDPVSLTGDFQSEIHYITNTFTITDNFTVIHNAHTLKAGMQILHLDSTRYQNTGMTTFYNSLADLIADKAAMVRVTFGSNKALANLQSGFYVSDDWRVNRHLLLKVGLRYEYYTPLHGAFNVATSDPFGPFIKDKSQPMFATNPHDFGPRLGFVWDPLGNQKFVIRAGGSLTYMPLQPILLYDFAFISPLLPFSANFTPADAGASVSLAFPFPQNAFVQQATANPSIVSALGLTLGRNVADFNSKDGASGQWNLSIQSALTSNLAFQASYVGNRAYHLWVPTFPNQFLPGSPVRPAPSIGATNFTCSCATSNYHALQISLNEKNFHGLILDAYYTWAKTLSYGVANGTNNVANNNVQDVYNFRGSYGPVDGDIRHLFVLDHSYLLPTPGFAQKSSLAKGFLGGWALQGIMTKRSGFPLNVFSGLDLVRNQRTTGDRPNLVSGPDPYIRNTNTLLWLNAAAFDNQTPFNSRQYGNLGYNALFGPGAFTYDAALHKAFRITEGSTLTFRGEAFNIFNHEVFNLPVNTLTNPQFGLITSGSPGRKVQLALTYAF